MLITSETKLLKLSVKKLYGRIYVPCRLTQLGHNRSWTWRHQEVGGVGLKLPGLPYRRSCISIPPHADSPIVGLVDRMLLVLSEDHKEHLSFLPKVDAAGTLVHLHDNCQCWRSPRDPPLAVSSFGLGQDVTQVVSTMKAAVLRYCPCDCGHSKVPERATTFHFMSALIWIGCFYCLTFLLSSGTASTFQTAPQWR